MRGSLLGAASALIVAALAVAGPSPAFADEDGVAPAEKPKPEPDPLGTKPGYVQLFFTSFVGDGLRFNNPYRLATPLGDDAESLSTTAPYVDIGIAFTLGHPLGIQHGAALRTSVAARGVGQVVMTPSYLAWRRWRALAVYGRAGTPLVLTPDVTWGLEAGLGATYFFLGGIGVAAEVVGDVFYGAGTREKATTTYPVLSGQLGFVVAYEVLP
ncbi:MAG TPA: hypothetical protein VLT33_23745 [Labilithrix sp.]|nr:hypothetical protein [Labilithrix sp.]